VRDHFYRNVENTAFFDVFASLYPWNGDRWLQVNINRLQSTHLTDVDGFAPERVSELSTAISEKFLEPFGRLEVLSVRRRMGLILADGSSVLTTVALVDHLAGVRDWMQQQNPVLLGRRAGVELDPAAEGLIVLLQPTRIIARKRIERDLHLLGALFGHEAFREAFTTDDRTLQLHITGPVPIEHQVDLETVLKAFGDVVNSLPAGLADRVFLSFSVGKEDHESFAAQGFERLTIEDIYRMADAVVFPSETEGRGLPIVEASACGVSIICSRYKPEQVFADVVGEDRPKHEQIRTIHFPDDVFSESFLDEISSLLLTPSADEARRAHNKAAVRRRYSRDRLQATFAALVDTF
jgi:glycosyltransferase involved in cell wall biosynthesis